jgi:hypothetical protein
MVRMFFHALTMILLMACGTVTPVPDMGTPPAPASAWTVKMAHSGGIMGLLRVIEVSSTGNFTVLDERAQKTSFGQLSDAERSHLTELVADAVLAEPARLNNGCADCFVYTLEISVAGKSFKAQVNDISLPNSGLEGLVTFLRGVMDQALK